MPEDGIARPPRLLHINLFCSVSHISLFLISEAQSIVLFKGLLPSL